MSYPDPRYFGEHGEISAVYRPAEQGPELKIASATQMSYLAKGTSTNGKFGLYRVDLQPKALGPSAHFHKTISESFFVLSGTVKLFNGERWIDATTGDFLYVPEGGIHGFHNETFESASMLLLFAPGAPREAYFEALAGISAGHQLTEEEWAEICLRHDNYFIDSKSQSLYKKLLSKNR